MYHIGQQGIHISSDMRVNRESGQHHCLREGLNNYGSVCTNLSACPYVFHVSPSSIGRFRIPNGSRVVAEYRHSTRGGTILDSKTYHQSPILAPREGRREHRVESSISGGAIDFSGGAVTISDGTDGQLGAQVLSLHPSPPMPSSDLFLNPLGRLKKHVVTLMEAERPPMSEVKTR